MQRSRWSLISLVWCLMMIGFAPVVSAQPSPIYPVRMGSQPEAYSFRDLVNQTRCSFGFFPLQLDERLNAAARRQLDDMLTNGVDQSDPHTGSDGSTVGTRADQTGYPWLLVAENIGLGMYHTSELYSEWMASSGHQLNMLNPSYRHIGLAFAYAPGSAHTYYWVAVFANDNSTATPCASMPGASLLSNGNFDSGLNNWTPLDLTDQFMQNGVFHYQKTSNVHGAGGVLIQSINTAQQTAPLGYEASFDMGNTSSLRKRALILIHDPSFSEITVCSFYLPPNQPLRSYRMVVRSTQAWSGLAISFYPASSRDAGHLLLDNVTLRRSTAPARAPRTLCHDPNAPITLTY